MAFYYDKQSFNVIMILYSDMIIQDSVTNHIAVDEQLQFNLVEKPTTKRLMHHHP